MSQTEQILLELFEAYPEATTGEIVERTGLARRTVQKYLTLLVDEKNWKPSEKVEEDTTKGYTVQKSPDHILLYLKMISL